MLTDLYLGAPTHRYPDEEAAALAADERANRPLGPGAEIELVYLVVHASCVGEPLGEPERGESRAGRVPRVREAVAGHGVAAVHRVRPPQVPNLENG